MTWETVGSAGADDSGEILVRITAGPRRRYRVLAGDAPALLAGRPAVLYAEEGEPIGDIRTSASGRMLIGASRAGLGFVPGGTACPVGPPAFAIVRDHLRAHYGRNDGTVEVLRGGA